MPVAGSVTPRSDGHGDVFAPGMGSMIVHVQRETGLAHRTFVLQPWQIRLVRAGANRWTRILLVAILVSWGYLAFQAARVPLLTNRIVRMEQDATRLDTLQQTMRDLQARYDQVQAMLSRTSAGTPVDATQPPAAAAGVKRP